LDSMRSAGFQRLQTSNHLILCLAGAQPSLSGLNTITRTITVINRYQNSQVCI
jgi:hypothetical protein